MLRRMRFNKLRRIICQDKRKRNRRKVRSVCQEYLRDSSRKTIERIFGLRAARFQSPRDSRKMDGQSAPAGSVERQSGNCKTRASWLSRRDAITTVGVIGPGVGAVVVVAVQRSSLQLIKGPRSCKLRGWSGFIHGNAAPRVTAVGSTFLFPAEDQYRRPADNRRCGQVIDGSVAVSRSSCVLRRRGRVGCDVFQQWRKLPSL